MHGFYFILTSSCYLSLKVCVFAFSIGTCKKTCLSGWVPHFNFDDAPL